jgi:hypothetical protein
MLMLMLLLGMVYGLLCSSSLCSWRPGLRLVRSINSNSAAAVHTAAAAAPVFIIIRTALHQLLLCPAVKAPLLLFSRLFLGSPLLSEYPCARWALWSAAAACLGSSSSSGGSRCWVNDA